MQEHDNTILQSVLSRLGKLLGLSLAAGEAALTVVSASSLFTTINLPVSGLPLAGALGAIAVAAVALKESEYKAQEVAESTIARLREVADALYSSNGNVIQQLREHCQTHGIDASFLDHDPDNENVVSPFVRLLSVIDASSQNKLSYVLETSALAERRVLTAIDAVKNDLKAGGVLSSDLIVQLEKRLRDIDGKIESLKTKVSRICRQTDGVPLLDLTIYNPQDVKDEAVNRYLYTLRRVPLFGREKELQLIGDFVDSSDESHLWQFWQGGAGVGKSRLAYEVCRDYTLDGWYAGFLSRTHSVKGSPPQLDWLGSPLRRNTLIVIDYVSHRLESVVPLLTSAFSHRNDLVKDGYRLKFLLLDRAVTEEWAAQVKSLTSPHHESWRQGEYPAPIESVRASNDPSISEGMVDARSTNDVIAYLNTVDDVLDGIAGATRRERMLDDTLRSVWMEKHDVPSEEVMDSLRATTIKIDPQVRPLWGAMTAAVASRVTTERGVDPVSIIADLGREEVLSRVLADECARWGRLGLEEVDFNLIFLARMVNGLKFDPKNPVLKQLIDDKLLPSEPRKKLLTLLRGLSTKPVVDENYFPALEPDLLGERYVLSRIEGNDATQINDSVVNSSRECSKRLVTAAWDLDPKAAGYFVAFTSRDFLTTPVLVLGTLLECPSPDRLDAQLISAKVNANIARWALKRHPHPEDRLDLAIKCAERVENLAKARLGETTLQQIALQSFSVLLMATKAQEDCTDPLSQRSRRFFSDTVSRKEFCGSVSLLFDLFSEVYRNDVGGLVNLHEKGKRNFAQVIDCLNQLISLYSDSGNQASIQASMSYCLDRAISCGIHNGVDVSLFGNHIDTLVTELVDLGDGSKPTRSVLSNQITGLSNAVSYYRKRLDDDKDAPQAILRLSVHLRSLFHLINPSQFLEEELVEGYGLMIGALRLLPESRSSAFGEMDETLKLIHLLYDRNDYQDFVREYVLALLNVATRAQGSVEESYRLRAFYLIADRAEGQEYLIALLKEYDLPQEKFYDRFVQYKTTRSLTGGAV